VLVLLDIYPAREAPIDGVTSDLISEAATEGGMNEIYRAASPKELPEIIGNILRPGDVILTIGAGSITNAAAGILQLAGEEILQTEDSLSL
jgi:UDP-N-acetylmuramate--alanine ligase